MFVEIPLIYMSVKILKFWAYIYDASPKRYISISILIFHLFTEWAYLYEAHDDASKFIRNIFLNSLAGMAVIRAISLVINNEKMQTLLSNLEQYFYDLKKSKDPYIQKLIKDTNNAGERMARVNLFLGSVSGISFVIYPLLSSERVLMFSAAIPGIDFYKTPFYEILYIYQIICTGIACCMFVPYTSLIVGFIMFGILMCKSLQHRLRTMKINNENPKLLHTQMAECIDEQNCIINYISSINSLIANIFLFEYLGFGILLCATLFLLVIEKDLGEFVMVCVNIITILAQIFPLYWYANELKEEFEEIAFAAYDAEWYTFPVPVQKCTLLIILRAQKTVSLTVGNIHPIDLVLFQTLLNASYRFFTVLKHMYG